MSLNKWLVGFVLQPLNQEADWPCDGFLLRSGQLPPPWEPPKARREDRGCGNHTGVSDGFCTCPLLLQSRPGLEFGQSCFLGTFACMMMTQTEQKQGGLYVWRVAWLTPPHVFNIFVPFFICHFLCHLSSTAQILVGLRSREEGQSSCLLGTHFCMRLKTRPRSGHSHRDPDHVHSYSILLWPRTWQGAPLSSGFGLSDWV